jgi:hypothetical protein
MYRELGWVIDAHGLKIQGRGYLKFLPKSLGVKDFRKNFHGGHPILGFSFLLVSVLKFAGGILYLPSPLPPLCASMVAIMV